MDDPGDQSRRHRFFHAMVLMGGSLALGCGGLSEENERQPPPGGSGSGGNASGGSTSAAGSGGSTSVGGSGDLDGGVADGGSAAAGSGGSPACPPQQWTCTEPSIYCAGYGYALPDSCPCDLGKPLSLQDCEPSEWLVCLDGRGPGSVGSDDSVPFDCRCEPAQDSCDTICDARTGDPGATCSETVSDDGTSVLCGCAVIVLR